MESVVAAGDRGPSYSGFDRVDAPATAAAVAQDDPVMAWAAAETARSRAAPAGGRAFENASAAAPAEGGGWFSSVMLDALDKYHPDPATAVRPGDDERARLN